MVYSPSPGRSVLPHPQLNTRLLLQVTWLGEEPVVAVWSEKGQVEVFALRPLLRAVDDAQAMTAFLRDEQARIKPTFSFAGHMGEGFALDWSPRVPGESGCPLRLVGKGKGLPGRAGTKVLPRYSPPWPRPAADW